MEPKLDLESSQKELDLLKRKRLVCAYDHALAPPDPMFQPNTTQDLELYRNAGKILCHLCTSYRLGNVQVVLGTCEETLPVIESVSATVSSQSYKPSALYTAQHMAWQLA